MNFGGGDDDDIDTSVEDDILAHVKDETGEDFGDSDDDASGDEGPTEEGDDETEEQRAPRQARQSRQDNSRDGTQRRQEPRGIPTHRGTDYDYDREGNVIDAKTKEILYPINSDAGNLFRKLQDARFNRSRLEGTVRDMAARGKQLENVLNEMRQHMTVGDNLKLSTADQVVAMNHMAAFRSKPVEALRGMLKQFMAEGGDLSDIFDELPKLQMEGLEGRIASHVDKLTKPQEEAQAEQNRQRQLVNDVRGQIETFFGDHPEAFEHRDTLAHIITRAGESGRQMSLPEAYQHLMRFANAQGLDLSQPLQAQLAPVEQRPTQRPVPRNTGGRRMERSGKTRSYDASSKDFVREAMEEAGFDV